MFDFPTNPKGLYSVTKPIDAILLAAGLSSRMAPQDKLQLLIDGIPMLQHVAMVLTQCELRKIHVILPHEAFEKRRDCLEGLDVSVHQMPNCPISMGLSLSHGIKQVDDDCEACMVALADMPAISNNLINSLLAGAKPDTIVAPQFQGRRGHPIVFGKSFFPDLMKLSKDQGARSVIKCNQSRLNLVEVGEAGCLIDLDTADDYQSYQDSL